MKKKVAFHFYLGKDLFVFPCLAWALRQTTMVHHEIEGDARGATEDGRRGTDGRLARQRAGVTVSISNSLSTHHSGLEALGARAGGG